MHHLQLTVIHQICTYCPDYNLVIMPIQQQIPVKSIQSNLQMNGLPIMSFQKEDVNLDYFECSDWLPFGFYKGLLVSSMDPL